MLRLLYLLIRQRLGRAAPTAAPMRSPSVWLVAGAGALAAALGVAVHLYFGPARSVAPSAAGTAASDALLNLHVARVDAAPLVVYLEAVGAVDATADRALAERDAVHLTSVNGVFEPAFQMAPLAARIEVGNADTVAHNTHVFDGRRTLFNVAMPLQDTPVTKVLTRPGLFEVRCDLHPWMRAALFVPPGPHHLLIREPGDFTLREIRPGRYLLHTWAADRGRTTQAVELLPGVARTLELAAQ